MSLNVSRKSGGREDAEQTFNEMKELKKEDRRRKALDEGKKSSFSPLLSHGAAFEIVQIFQVLHSTGKIFN